MIAFTSIYILLNSILGKMNVRLTAYSIALLFLLVPIAGCVGQDDSVDAEDMFDCDNGNQVQMSSVNDGVDDCGAVSYTHLTLPTKRIV